MSRAWKITWITLLSLLGVVLVATTIVIAIAFSPSRITPIVQKEASKFLNCEVEVGGVSLVFFSTFPDFSLKIENLTLSNPAFEAERSRVLSVEECYAKVDMRKFLADSAVDLSEFHLRNADLWGYVDKDGRSNFAPLIEAFSSEDDTDEPFVMPFDNIDLDNVTIDNLNCHYEDSTTGQKANIEGLNLSLGFGYNPENSKAAIVLTMKGLDVDMGDSVAMRFAVRNPKVNIDGGYGRHKAAGKLVVKLPNTDVDFGGVRYLDGRSVVVELPFAVDVDAKQLTVSDAAMNLDDLKLYAGCKIGQRDSVSYDVDMTFSSDDWNLDRVMGLVPSAYSAMMSDVTAKGECRVSGSVVGLYSDKSMPVVSANVNYVNGDVRYRPIPLPLRNVVADVSVTLDMNEGRSSSAEIRQMRAQTGRSSVSVSGSVEDVMNAMRCRLVAQLDGEVSDFGCFMPSDVAASGAVKADVKAAFAVADVVDMRLGRMDYSGNVAIGNLYAQYADTMSVVSPNLKLKFNSKHSPTHSENVAVRICADRLNLAAGADMSANVDGVDIDADVYDFLRSERFLGAVCNYRLGRTTANATDKRLDLTASKGRVRLAPSSFDRKEMAVECDFDGEQVEASMPEQGARFDKLALKAKVDYNPAKQSVLDIWSPRVSADAASGELCLSAINSPVAVPHLRFDYRDGVFDVADSRVVVEDSDFKLEGRLSNIANYLDGKGLLTGAFDFTSDKTDVTQLMALTSGIGCEDATPESVEEQTTTANEESNPFMVPKGVDVTLNTHISNALYDKTALRNIGGTLIVRDGALVLEQMGFTTEAARMQLTALYRSDRRNHLFAGFDFHLLDIDIKKLIEIIPQVDTIVPMLKAFEGAAEFHIAAETYLKANYDIKMSTLRAAAAIEGKDLVVMDGETFKTISKYLMFKNSTQNKVDSLSVEMTVFRDEVDVYPFLIAIDKWKAVISGRHNLDMTFDYHVSVTDCPLPVRLGLDVGGNIDNLKFKLVPCKYKYLYSPDKRNVTQENTLRLKKLISDNLKKNVKQG